MFNYPKKNILKIKKIFSKNYEPYEIGYISKGKIKQIYQTFVNGKKKKTCIFISGQGSNLKNLIYHSRNNNFPIKISLVISNNEKSLRFKLC